MYIYIYIYVYSTILLYMFISPPHPPAFSQVGGPGRLILYWFFHYFRICGMTAALGFAREAPDIQTLA